MKVVVFTHELNCPAVLALQTEGVAFTVALSRTPTDYADNWCEYWDMGQPFIAVEHDIVPWPGAIKQLGECVAPWCTHEAPMAADHNLVNSFFIGKYKPSGKAPDSWRVTSYELDGMVIPTLKERLNPHPHIHYPPVAHARSKRAEVQS